MDEWAKRLAGMCEALSDYLAGAKEYLDIIADQSDAASRSSADCRASPVAPALARVTPSLASSSRFSPAPAGLPALPVVRRQCRIGRCRIAERHFDDILSLIRLDGRWQIIAKVFDYEIAATT